MEGDVSDHTQSMRRAARYCLDLLEDFLQPLPTFTFGNEDRSRVRRETYDRFWKDGEGIPEIEWNSLAPVEFRKQYHDRNIPCLIHFDGESNYFQKVNQLWRKKTDNESSYAVDRDWFIGVLGEDTLVPVRFQPNKGSLDEEGRAMECETREMLLREWIQLLEQPDDDRYYLKDWHLLLQSQEKNLYSCPPIFGFDLLNSFLTRFTPGDYRFCYWGPKGSFTSRHSDVLHSFSWSYNVVGTKQWTFFGPEGDECMVIQEAGQAMFVPSQWQHEVVNLEETLSINHNWITTSNLDACWDCLTTEIAAIEMELGEWGIEDWEAHESMLRGCVGLAVTSFFFMILVRLCDLLSGEESEERGIDFSRLVRMIQVLRTRQGLHFEARLAGVLQSGILTSEILHAMDHLLASVDRTD